jgi:uncharacterized protein (TIGR00725 family)
LITPLRIAVCGPGQAEAPLIALAESIGRGVAQASAILLCGGLGGVMEAACRGAREAGGLTVGLLPSTDVQTANPAIVLPIVTGMAEARNMILIHSAEAVIAVGGGWGTLSEIALARRAGLVVVGVESWPPSGTEALVEAVATPEAAVDRALAAARQRRGSAGSAVYHIDISAATL